MGLINRAGLPEVAHRLVQNPTFAQKSKETGLEKDYLIPKPTVAPFALARGLPVALEGKFLSCHKNLWICQESARLSLGSGLRTAGWCRTPRRVGEGWGWGRAGREQGGAQWTPGLELVDDRNVSSERVDQSQSLHAQGFFLSSPLVKCTAPRELLIKVPERSPVLGLDLTWHNKEGTYRTIWKLNRTSSVAARTQIQSVNSRNTRAGTGPSTGQRRPVPAHTIPCLDGRATPYDVTKID